MSSKDILSPMSEGHEKKGHFLILKAITKASNCFSYTKTFIHNWCMVYISIMFIMAQQFQSSHLLE